MEKPNSNDYPEYFGNYINQVPENDISEALVNQTPLLREFLGSISEEKSNFAYAPGKWTIKEVVQHMIDGERIFGYRALCIARKDATSLPSFDENSYAENSNANARKWNDIRDEFLDLRVSTIDLFNSFTEEMWNIQGLANNKTITPLSLAFVTVGHVYHHIKVIKDCYI